MAVKVRPLHDRLIVERIEETEQKVGGIIIPDTAKEKPQQGKVVAVGKGKLKDDGTAGDKVLFGKYSGQEIKLDGDEYLIMREDEILGVLESD
ncbi:10 kDa chaperonin [Geodia barretti]|uniref:10 kDa heat shock protein, mitochondrial n=1 Tax=Geodia barretti TaxID=519541 RepID=A0AA35XEK6_GEOBA|nr:10 kDa chaperonin [Geodia barretti]